ncbi:hypothetical protein MF406_03250 [Georgenia sp. TF02-10]|uniref:hypothetical protein n=1 Tax=Georgenia sp. TF02-10 TaxID=2917725 RepID=UPI001FA79BE7|nr:hypothetical protein [Georgenia sp. TF02-10]UNX55303.1 hypothetical protein MF406_03250 [Georgenia sp. TF02-10]
MGSLTGLILSALALFVWAYVTYFVVRRAVRDGMEDHVLLQRERTPEADRDDARGTDH